MSFVQRRLEFAIKLAATGNNQPNTFAETGGDTISIANARASVRIQNSGGLAGSTAQVAIWGLTPSLMGQLSTLGMVIQQVPRNSMTVTAGDAESGMSAVFVGVIIQAYADYDQAPDVPFRFELNATAAEAVIPFTASSYSGSADVATILSTIAQNAGWAFENNGVSVQLSNPYFAGSAVEQVEKIRRAARINAEVLPGNSFRKLLAIWPQYGSRQNLGTPLIAPPPLGQMIGYPGFTQQGIAIKNVFNPSLVQGAQVTVQSSIFTLQSLQKLDNLSSTWVIMKIDHALDTLVPHGQWMSSIQAFNPRFPSPLPKQ